MRQRIFCISEGLICSAFCIFLEQWEYAPTPFPYPPADAKSLPSCESNQWVEQWAEVIAKTASAGMQPDTVPIILIYAHLCQGQRSRNHGFYLADTVQGWFEGIHFPIVVAVMDPLSAERSSTKRSLDAFDQIIFPTLLPGQEFAASDERALVQWDIFKGQEELAAACALALRMAHDAD